MKLRKMLSGILVILSLSLIVCANNDLKNGLRYKIKVDDIIYKAGIVTIFGSGDTLFYYYDPYLPFMMANPKIDLNDFFTTNSCIIDSSRGFLNANFIKELFSDYTIKSDSTK